MEEGKSSAGMGKGEKDNERGRRKAVRRVEKSRKKEGEGDKIWEKGGVGHSRARGGVR
jgi:hypothetical protein